MRTIQIEDARIELNRRGANRWVLLTRRYAFKFPSLHSWRDFLFGLLNNQNEAQMSRGRPIGLCPVLYSFPGGFLNVMPRVCILTREEFYAAPHSAIYRSEFRTEHKPDSFGWLNGEIVCVDYGW